MIGSLLGRPAETGQMASFNVQHVLLAGCSGFLGAHLGADVVEGVAGAVAQLLEQRAEGGLPRRAPLLQEPRTAAAPGVWGLGFMIFKRD